MISKCTSEDERCKEKRYGADSGCRFCWTKMRRFKPFGLIFLSDKGETGKGLWRPLPPPPVFVKVVGN